MSDYVSIAAVTARLYTLFDKGLKVHYPGLSITTRPPDQAREGIDGGDQINIFLYHIVPNPSWSAMDLPWKTHSGEKAGPVLPLNLRYLITVYSESGESIDTTTDPQQLLGPHRLLGHAMSLLHDNAVIDADAVTSVLPASDAQLHPFDQKEKIRITPLPLPIEEVSKLWSGFQAEYRLSMAYEVSVVLIESSRTSTAALPVLRRGPNDQGVIVLPGSPPLCTEIIIPHGKASVEPGDTVGCMVQGISPEHAVGVFTSPLLSEPIELDPVAGGTSSKISFLLPSNGSSAAQWPAGLYRFHIEQRIPGVPVFSTNTVIIALAARIVSLVPSSISLSSSPMALTVEFRPQLRSSQHVQLILGNLQISAASMTTPANPLLPSSATFALPAVAAAHYVVRLRIDGVDTIPIDFSTVPPQFDANQKVTVTP
jgi:hypothetical protein